MINNIYFKKNLYEKKKVKYWKSVKTSNTDYIFTTKNRNYTSYMYHLHFILQYIVLNVTFLCTNVVDMSEDEIKTIKK